MRKKDVVTMQNSKEMRLHFQKNQGRTAHSVEQSLGIANG